MSRRAGTALLILPLSVFLALFFLWPLTSMLSQSVSDPSVGRVLPRTVAALPHWNGQGLPDTQIQRALADDLAVAKNDMAVGDMVRRLNSAQPGFRSLMSKTLAAVRKDPAIDLESLDRKWKNPAYWQAIAGALRPYTDRNLLAAVDLERNASGNIVRMDPSTSANGRIILRTLLVSALVTLCCLAIGLPYALILASVRGWRRALMLGAVLLPLWTSLLVRTAAWFILLQDNGLINQILVWLHLIAAPLPLIFNRLGVVIAMTHVLLPFMVLPIYSVLITVPANLMPAAASLGARPLRAFWRVLLPLSLRGVLSGTLLVFMSSIGYYITPALVGGANDQMISSVIAQYATGSANWGMAGALGTLLLAITLVLYAGYGWLSRDEGARA